MEIAVMTNFDAVERRVPSCIDMLHDGIAAVEQTLRQFGRGFWQNF